MYSLDVLITTNNAGIRNAVSQLLLSIDDPRVNVYDYQNSEGVNSDGIAFLLAMIRYDLESDRDGALNSIKGLTGVINACETPSHVRPHLCNGNDEPCTIQPGGVYK